MIRHMEQSNRQSELDNCNFCKAILMLSVVLYHVVLPWAGWGWHGLFYDDAPVLRLLAIWLNTFHIYGFALISGYIFSYLRIERNRYENYGEFLKIKAKRLLIPYIMVSILWVVPSSSVFIHYDWEDILRCFVLGVEPGQLWFLLMLFGVFAIFYPLTDFFHKNTLYGGLLVFLLYVVGTVGNKIIANYFQIWSVCRYLLFFWIGFKLRQFGTSKIRRIPAYVYVIVDILLFAFVSLIPKNNLILNALASALTMVLYVVGAIMAFVVLQSLADRIDWKNKKELKPLLRYSMPIYLVHQQLTYPISFLMEGMINPYLQVLINFILVVAVSAIISSVLCKFNITRRIIGEV